MGSFKQGEFKQGDIVVAKISFTNLSDFKVRPILILVKRLKYDDFIVLKISSKKGTDEYSFLLQKKDIVKGFLKVLPSYVIIDNPITIHRKNIRHKVAELKEEIMEKIKEKTRSLYQ